MKKRIVVLGFLVAQTASLFATVEDATSATAETPVLAVEDTVKTISEAPVDTTNYFDENNDIIEMDAQKALPEYRWTTIGVTLGGGVSYYNSTPANNHNVPCIRGGLNFDIPVGQWFSIQPELLFSTRGGGYAQMGVKKTTNKVNDPGKPYEYDVVDHLFYFDVPINVKLSKRMNFSRETTGRAYISAGPVLSLGVFAKDEAELWNGRKKVNAFVNELNAPGHEWEHALYRNFDFGFNFRLGYDFDFEWSFALGYQMGLVNLFNDSKFDASEADYYKKTYSESYPSLKNNSLYVTVGYRW
ncbi:MAG: PorT family protein [Paludibacteraceae bacterium]|nr:PorT family protein [Paludibacteraceae bacterium]